MRSNNRGQPVTHDPTDSYSVRPFNIIFSFRIFYRKFEFFLLPDDITLIMVFQLYWKGNL